MLRYTLILLLILAPCLSGCALVDEDLSGCGVDYKMDYEMELVTNMTTELTTQFGVAANVNVTAALRPFLQPIFTE